MSNRLKIQPIYLVSREPGLALARVLFQTETLFSKYGIFPYCNPLCCNGSVYRNGTKTLPPLVGVSHHRLLLTLTAQRGHMARQ